MTTQLWGIINVTPDSFYDGNPQNTLDTLAARAQAYIKDGADVLDIGGESTRPGATPISEQTELARVLPLIKTLRARGIKTPLSLDTRHISVAAAGLENGVTIINDVSGNPTKELFSLVKKHQAQLVLMHTRGTPQTMQSQTDYTDLLSEVKEFLAEKISQATAAGLIKNQLIIDVGFGFAKDRVQNYHLLKHLKFFKDLDIRLLVALSRKSFLSQVGDTPQDRLPQTLAAHLIALQQGADILRVHDVKETRQLLHFYNEWEDVR
ncbi:dihydropteroate synthase [Candidatus Avelusimicrobium caledoniensis]|uniref:dihydropteroate synthase n=1 Tax=Candidatus Avelusimicrobium caledoniensis TaxID=3416220 RepID=UPI003D126EA4